MARVQCAIRMPVELKRLIAEACVRCGVTETSFVVNACWCELDRYAAEAIEEAMVPKLPLQVVLTPSPMPDWEKAIPLSRPDHDRKACRVYRCGMCAALKEAESGT